IAGVFRGALVMLVHPSVPARSVPEFIAYAKVNARKVSMASSGTGASAHLAGELFKAMAGVDLGHVPYRGGGAGGDGLLGGGGRGFVGPDGREGGGKGGGGGGGGPGPPRPLAGGRCRTSRPWGNLCLATRRASGTASAHKRLRPPRSSTSSTRRLTRRSPIL